jgi:hypothetical protein
VKANKSKKENGVSGTKQVSISQNLCIKANEAEFEKVVLVKDERGTVTQKNFAGVLILRLPLVRKIKTRTFSVLRRIRKKNTEYRKSILLMERFILCYRGDCIVISWHEILRSFRGMKYRDKPGGM